MDRFPTNTQISLHKTLIDVHEVVWITWDFVMFYQLYELTLRHPFTAEDPLVIYILDGWSDRR